MRFRSLYAVLLIGIATLGVAFLLQSCVNDDRDDDGGSSEIGKPVTMKASLNLLGDLNDPDSYVKTIRILTFDASSGDMIGNKKYNSASGEGGKFTFGVKAGKLRIYFIANETDKMTASLDAVYSEQSLLSDKECSQSEYDPGVREPSISNPLLMSAKIDVDIPLSWDASVPFVVKDPVSLVRASSKMTFSLKKDFTSGSAPGNYKEVIDVKSVRLMRVPSKYDAVNSGSAFSGIYYGGDINLELATGGNYLTENNWFDQYNTIYIPEHIPAINSADYATVIAVEMERYFYKPSNGNIKDRIRRVFLVPINTPADGYGLRRNNHYEVNCSIKGWTGDIYAATELVPWEKRKVEIEFDKPDFDIVKYVQAINNDTGMPVVSSQSPTIEYGICLKGPVGATWKVSLTNGMQFAFLDGEFCEYGSVDPNTFVKFGIRATYPWEDLLRETDIVVLVNNKEVYRISGIIQMP